MPEQPLLWEERGASAAPHGRKAPLPHDFEDAYLWDPCESAAWQRSHTRFPQNHLLGISSDRGRLRSTSGICHNGAKTQIGHDRAVAGSRHARQLEWQVGARRLMPHDRMQTRRTTCWLSAGRFRMRAMWTVALVIGVMCALLPHEVSGQIPLFRPMYQFQGQVLTLCLDPPETVYENAATKYIYPTVCRNPFIEPDVNTEGKGQLKACSHDSSVYFECPGVDPAGCQCFGTCLPNVGFAAECLDVVFALEDTWWYLGVFINHAPGAAGNNLPFIGQTSHHLIFKLTVNYGELDILDTLRHCLWMDDHKNLVSDPEATTLDMYCNVVPSSLPGDFGKSGNHPYHLRYKRYLETDFVKRMSVEFSGNFEQVDPLIKIVKYKAIFNENSNRIKSPIYNPLSYNKVPNEKLFIEVSTYVDVNIPSTDR